MRYNIIAAFIAGCLLQSNALAEVGRYQPSQPQQFYEHHQRLGMQRYAVPQGQSVYVPPRPTFVAPQPVPQPQRYAPPPQPTAPQWHQRAQQHQVPQVGNRTAQTRHMLTTPQQGSAYQKAEANYIKPWKRSSETTREGNDLNIGLSVGYRVDELDWTIAGNLAGTSPNILSELEWEDVQMIELRGEADYLINRSMLKGVYLEGSVHAAQGFAGDTQDSDFDGDNRTSEYSRSNNSATGSHAAGYSIGLGYQFDLVNKPNNRFFITPLVGYESNIVTMKSTDGEQTIETPGRTPGLGPIDGLDSQYEAEWSGAYFGLKLGSIFGKHALNLRGDYHTGDFLAEAEWNLRDGFQQPLSFIHEGDSEGVSFKADYAYSLRPDLALFFSGSVKSFIMEDGLDTTYASDGSILGQTKVNEANWTSSSLHAGVKWRF